jgi:hypothetical protein
VQKYYYVFTTAPKTENSGSCKLSTSGIECRVGDPAMIRTAASSKQKYLLLICLTHFDLWLSKNWFDSNKQMN